jgi:hypothetical protein
LFAPNSKLVGKSAYKPNQSKVWKGLYFYFILKNFRPLHIQYIKGLIYLFIYYFIILLNFSFRWFVLFAVFIVLIKGGEKEKKRKEIITIFSEIPPFCGGNIVVNVVPCICIKKI